MKHRFSDQEFDDLCAGLARLEQRLTEREQPDIPPNTRRFDSWMPGSRQQAQAIKRASAYGRLVIADRAGV